MKFQPILLLFLFFAESLFSTPIYTLKSPDKKIEIQIEIADKISYSVYKEKRLVLDKSAIAIITNNNLVFGDQPKVIKSSTREITENIASPLYKYPSFKTAYNELNIKFKGGYGIHYRAYNQGISYRFYSELKKPIEIRNEIAEFNFDKNYRSFRAYTTGKKDKYAMAFQNLYTESLLTNADSGSIAFLPVTIDYGQGLKMTILESDLEAYPGMFIKSVGNSTSLKAEFAPYPKNMRFTAGRQQMFVNERENLIAKTNGTRTFPWRILAITSNDTEMPVNDLVYALASPSRISDNAWVKGGLAAWEWWNDWGISNINFKAGINMKTYQHYIDFAHENNIQYVVLDEGWYDPKSGDMLTVIPELDIPELVKYAKDKNVYLFLWTVFNVLDKQLDEACSKYASMGIKGFKVDFLDRDDQTAVEMVYRIAHATAKHKLMLDLHGMYKPTGLNRTFPNIINFESVFGMEEVKWSKIEKDMMKYDVILPFIRMMAGPIDYTPGAMQNANKNDFRDIYYDPMSQGTRCHQLALYVVHDSPFTMLADNPTSYRKEIACTKFITSIPNTNIDETKILQGELGEFIVTARRKQSDWFIGGITNWNSRDIVLDFSFLPEGNFQSTLFKDGANAEKKASDYAIENMVVNNKTTLKIHVAPGGGFAIRLKKII